MKDAAIRQMRVGAMLVIVLYHCVCYYGIWTGRFPDALQFESIGYWRALCNVALNAFVFISGLLYAKLYVTKEKYRNRKTMLKDKAARLLFPYIFWSALALLLFPSGHAFIDFLSGAQHLWFLLMLMSVFVVIIGMGHNVLNIKLLVGEGAFAILLNIALAKYGSNIPNYGAWQTAVRYLPAFICGMLAVRLEMTEKMAHWPKTAQILTIVVASLLVIYVGYSPSLPLGLLYHNLPTYCFLICLYVILSTHPFHLGQSIIDNLDRHSMGIYIIHHLLIWGILLYVPGITLLMDEHYIVSPIILFLIILTVSWTLSMLINKNTHTALLFNVKINPPKRNATN